MKGKQVVYIAEHTTDVAPVRHQHILLTAKQAAGRLNISYSTFQRWRKNPTLPKPFQYGSVQRWRIEDIDAFVAAHLQKQEVTQ